MCGLGPGLNWGSGGLVRQRLCTRSEIVKSAICLLIVLEARSTLCGK